MAIRNRTPSQMLPVFTITPEELINNIKTFITDTNKVYDNIASEVNQETASFNTVVRPVLLHANEKESIRYITSLYRYASPHADLRDASREAKRLLSEHYIEVGSRQDIFDLFAVAFDTKDSQGLDREALTIMNRFRRSYEEDGMLIPAGPKRERSMEITRRLTELLAAAQKNVNDEDSTMCFTPEELEGIPTEKLDLQTLEQGDGEHAGKVKVDFKKFTEFAIQKHAIRDSTRLRYYVAGANKYNANIPLIKEILQLRDEQARLQGHENHASARLGSTMARSPEAVWNFLNDLRPGLIEAGRRDSEKLLAQKQKELSAKGAEIDDNFYAWEVVFWKTRLREAEYSIDDEEVASYLPVEHTLGEMLQIFEGILGIFFVELDKEDQKKLSPTGRAEDVIWQEDVRIFSVWNNESEGDDFVGYLYFDLFTRDSKTKLACNFPITPGYTNPDGSRHHPMTAIFCNFERSTTGKPSLMRFADFQTCFHELGHAMHNLLSKTRYSLVHGTACSSPDFVEAPSQMLENWCVLPEVLRSISQHCETGAQMPEAMIEGLSQMDEILPAFDKVFLLQSTIVDMTIHTPESPEAVKELNIGKWANELRGQLFPAVKGPEDAGYDIEWGNMYAGWLYLLNGYDASMYGYLWSRVYAQDMFETCFKANPMDPVQGRRYRHIVLEPGSSADPMEMIKEFLGREPSVKPFYRHLGLET